MKMNFLKKLFKKDPVVGVKYKQIITADKIYSDATILECVGGNYLIKTTFVENISGNFVKLGVRSPTRVNFRNTVAFLSSTMIRFTGEPGDYIFYARLSRAFFYKYQSEIAAYLYPFVEYENAIVKCVRYTDDSI